MIELPRPLEPWRAWLALMAPDLALPLGQLLLQLHPLLGRLKEAAQREDSPPVGIGNIVRRGRYEHMLISEWAYADAAPDEFVRRAASGELLFNGPEPEAQRRSRLCVALFDAGPGQLGEPRLAQLALFILLARRAEEAGVEFQWGILQRPGSLNHQNGRAAIGKLLGARTLQQAGAADLAAWRAELAALKEDLGDCWLVGPPGTAAPAGVTARVTVAHSLLEPCLELCITQNRSLRSVVLPMPRAEVGVRLLRHPFDQASARPEQSVRVAANARPSLKQPPRFGAAFQWLAASRHDGGAIIYHVPKSINNNPGKVRLVDPPVDGSILAANVFKRNLAQIVTTGAGLSLRGFPGHRFSGDINCPRPPADQFRAPPGMGRWLPLYFQKLSGANTTERVFCIDIDRRLVCWEMGLKARVPSFRVIAEDVIGAEQFGPYLVYARCGHGQLGSMLWRWGSDDRAEHIGSMPGQVSRVVFGGFSWARGGEKLDLLAYQTSPVNWTIVYDGERIDVTTAEHVNVLGVAMSSTKHDARPGLVVLHPDRSVVHLYLGSTDRIELLRPGVSMGQVALDATSARISLIALGTHELSVYELHVQSPLLRARVDGDGNAE